MQNPAYEPLLPVSGGDSPSRPVVIRRQSGQAVLVAVLFGILLVLFVGGAIALAILTNPRVLDSLGLLIMFAIGALFGYGLLGTRTTFELTATHLIRRSALRPSSAIAWSELQAVRQPKPNALEFLSTWGERIDIGPEYASPALWSQLRTRVPAPLQTALVGLPGFAQPPALSRTAQALQVVLALSILLASMAARKVDWRDADVRCLRESLTSLLNGPVRCLDRAAAAHDAEWMQKLLDAGADPNRRDKQGALPLHGAVRNSFPDGVGVLLLAGAKPLLGSRDSSSPLDLAVEQHDLESLALMVKSIKQAGSREDAMTVWSIALEGKDTRLRPLVQSELGALLPRVVDPKIEQQYEALMREAEAAVKTREYGVVIARANDAIALDPDIGMGYYFSGYGYAEMQNWGRAKSRLRKAIELMPDHADLRQYLGTVYLRTGDYDEAEKILDEALRLNPELWDIYADRALVRSDAGRKQAALEDAALACRNDNTMGCEMEHTLLRELEDFRKNPD